LRVDAAGSAFTFYLNNAKLAAFEDATYSSGMVGFILANADAPKPHMHFDNLAIWTSDAPPQASGLDPVRKSDKGDLVLIPGGEFILGSNANRDEPPQIYQLPDFYIDRAEVTNALYRQCVAAKACTPLASAASHSHPDYANQPQYDAFPVINVSWQQASAFCGWAGKRLPTEAEFERAARGGLDRKKYDWGDELRPDGKPQANTWQGHFPNENTKDDGYVGTAPVASFPPNAFGLYDLAGNVWEWCSDWYRPDTYAKDAAANEVTRNPQGPADSFDPQEPGAKKRVHRGGSYLCSDQYCSRYVPGGRGKGATDSGTTHLGFRCVTSSLTPPTAGAPTAATPTVKPTAGSSTPSSGAAAASRPESAIKKRRHDPRTTHDQRRTKQREANAYQETLRARLRKTPGAIDDNGFTPIFGSLTGPRTVKSIAITPSPSPPPNSPPSSGTFAAAVLSP
jgi:formylglycine-generating enzyme required for sulfatase activity